MIPVQTPQHLFAVGAAAAFAFAVVLAVIGVLAAIGTVMTDEARPLLTTRAWMRAHRWPLAGLLWGARGAHKLGRRLTEAATADDEWHPLDKEAGNEDALQARLRRDRPQHDGVRESQRHERLPGDGRRDGGGLRPLPEELRSPDGASAGQAAGDLTTGDEKAGDGQPAKAPARDRQPRAQEDDGAGEVLALDQAHTSASAVRRPPDREASDEDLSGLSAEDTDTLRIFHAANAEHLVPTNEPDALDLMIEAHRQHTVADPRLGEWIRAALGFDTVDCYLDSMRRKLGAGAA